MRSLVLLAGLFLLASGPGQDPVPRELEVLFKARDWPALREALARRRGPVLYQGIVAAAFNQNQLALRTLQGVTARAPSRSISAP